MSWIVDRGEHLTTSLSQSDKPEWQVSGNFLANTISSAQLNSAGSPHIVGYTVNGYAAYRGVIVYPNGEFSVSQSYDSTTEPLVIDYVIQHGDKMLSSQAVITSGNLPQKSNVLPPVTYNGNSETGISGHAWDRTETTKKLVSFTVKTADGQTASHAAGSTVELADGIGTLQMRADGSFDFKPKNGYTGSVSEITTTVSDSNTTETLTGSLHLNQQSATIDGRYSTLSTDWQFHIEEYMYSGSKHLKTGNVLNLTTSTLGDKPFGKLEVTEFTVNGKTYQAGETATDPSNLAEDFTLLRDGTFIYYVTNETTDKSPSPPKTVSYTFSNGSVSAKSTVDIGVWQGFNDDRASKDYNGYSSVDDPLVYPSALDADENINVTGQYTSGMLLEKPFQNRVSDYNHVFFRYAKLTGFSIDGKEYKANDVASIFGLGTFTVNANGYYELKLEGQQVAGTKMPDVHYTLETYLESGTKTDSSVARFNLATGLKATQYEEANSKADAHAKLSRTHVLEHQVETGNLLDGYDTADKPYIAGFHIGNSYYAANQTVEIANVGLFTLNRDGSYYINTRELPNSKRAGWSIPEIAFTVSNGSKASSSSLFLQAGDKLKSIEPLVYDNDTLTHYGKSAQAYLFEAYQPIKVTSYTLGGKTYAAGEIAKTDIGTFVIHSDGLLKVNGTAAAEEAYRYQATYTLIPKDQSGKSAIATLDFTLDNSQNDTLKNHPLNLADVVDGDETVEAFPNGLGSVLSNTQNMLNGKAIDGSKFSVTDFTINGTTYKAGSVVALDFGTFELKSNGHFSLLDNYKAQYKQVDVHYTVSNGVKTDSSVLSLTYDGFHHPPSLGTAQEQDVAILRGNDHTAVMIGNVNKTHVSDSVLSAETLGIDIGKVVLIGDHLNVNHLSAWDNEKSDIVEGNQYLNSVDAVRDILHLKDQNNTDADIVKSIQEYTYDTLSISHPQGGNDTLIGAGGDDILVGGGGNDTLTGKGGNDIFVFSGNSGHDIITDFTKGQDKISLSGLLYDTTPEWDAASGVLSFTTSNYFLPASNQYPTTYQNTITLSNATPDLTLNDLLLQV